jgi:hypothetical protein
MTGQPHLSGFEPTDSEAIRAIRQRLSVLYATHAEITHEIDELQELQREILLRGER